MIKIALKRSQYSIYHSTIVFISSIIFPICSKGASKSFLIMAKTNRFSHGVPVKTEMNLLFFIIGNHVTLSINRGAYYMYWNLYSFRLSLMSSGLNMCTIIIEKYSRVVCYRLPFAYLRLYKGKCRR